MTAKSKVHAQTHPIEYMIGVTDCQSGRERNLNAYPYNSINQEAYEYGWADQYEAEALTYIATSSFRYKMWIQNGSKR